MLKENPKKPPRGDRHKKKTVGFTGWLNYSPVSELTHEQVCSQVDSWVQRVKDAQGPGFQFKHFIIGVEYGDNNKRHLQGTAYFSESMTLNYFAQRVIELAPEDWKKATPPSDRELVFHKKGCWAMYANSAKYCKKEGSYYEFGTVPGEEEKKSALQTFLDSMRNGEFTSREDFMWTSIYVKHQRAIDALWTTVVPRPVITLEKPYPWQQKLIDHIENDDKPHDRHINFVCDTKGNRGKSTLLRYLTCKYPRKVFGFSAIRNTSERDIINLFPDPSHWVPKMIIIDVSRTGEIPYSLAEMMKDGHLTHTKYEGGMKIYAIPFVYIFTNIHCDLIDRNLLSADRFFFVDLDSAFGN